MGQPATEGKKKPRMRWRIGRRNKSKKNADVDHDNDTIPNTPESSEAYSDGSCDVQNSPVSELPATMSDVDDDSDNDDELYVDDSNDDEEVIIKISELPKPPSEKEIEDDDSETDHGNYAQKYFTGDSPTNSFDSSTGDVVDDTEDDEVCEGQNIPSAEYSPKLRKMLRKDLKMPSNENDYSDYRDEGSDSTDDMLNEGCSFRENMKNHQWQRRKSPHFTKELAQIAEEVSAFDENLTAKKKTVGHNAPAVPPKKNENGSQLPSARTLSKELCKIVATDQYSGRESLSALEKLSEWAHTQDSTLLKHFLTYGGIVKVIDFLHEKIEDDNCKGHFLMESIHKAADVICNVCYVGKHGINEDIAIVNATVVVKYGGINTLLLVSDVYNKSNNKSDPMALEAIEGVWNAIMNVYCNAESAVSKPISMPVIDASIVTMEGVGSIDDCIATETLANVFNTLYRITYHDFVTKEEFKQKELLKHCLNVFKRDVTSSECDEELLEEAMSFFYGCHEKDLFDAEEYEALLPLCVMALRGFAAENDNIRQWASKLLDCACTLSANKELIASAEGAIEALAPFLTSKDLEASEKEELRKLIRKILMA